MVTRFQGMRGARIGEWQEVGHASVREVCLVGQHGSQVSWTPGDQLDLGGRTYRVAAAQADADTVRYVHLAPQRQDG
jgi:hypothetical protein